MDANVTKLLSKAAEAHDACAAMQYAQAALNAAQALQVVKTTGGEK